MPFSPMKKIDLLVYQPRPKQKPRLNVIDWLHRWRWYRDKMFGQSCLRNHVMWMTCWEVTTENYWEGRNKLFAIWYVNGTSSILMCLFLHYGPTVPLVHCYVVFTGAWWLEIYPQTPISEELNKESQRKTAKRIVCQLEQLSECGCVNPKVM